MIISIINAIVFALLGIALGVYLLAHLQRRKANQRLKVAQANLRNAQAQLKVSQSRLAMLKKERDLLELESD